MLIAPYPTAAASPYVTTDLALYYRHLDGSGQVLTDTQGTANGQLGSTTGADSNDPTWLTTGLSYGGDDFVRVPYSRSGAFTIGLGAAVIGTGVRRSYFSLYNGTSSVFILQRNSSNNLRIVDSIAGNFSDISGSSPGTVRNIVHVVLNPAGASYVYRNGVQVFTWTAANATYATTLLYPGATGAGLAEFWNGPQYLLRLHTRALSAAEITNEYTGINDELTGRSV